MGRINIEIPQNIHNQAKAYAALKGMTLMQYINEAIAEKVNAETRAEKTVHQPPSRKKR